MVIMKFGGSSLTTPEALGQIADIILANRFSRKVVVLSAVGGVTDILIHAIDEALRGEAGGDAAVDQLRQIHHALVKGAIPKPRLAQTALDAIDACLEPLDRLLRGVALTGEATDRVRDAIGITGERLSVRIMAAVVKAKGGEAISLDSDQIGLPAVGPFGQASADLALARQRVPQALEPAFRQDAIPLVTGFFGANAEGEPATFGRGGSDYAAAVLASALDATRLEIWKDVDGFLSGSPELVRGGHLLQSLSYDEAAELAYFGAKILHPRTVEPLLERQIPIVIRNVFRPDGLGTWIDVERHVGDPVVKSVTFDRNIALLRVHGVDVGYTVGLLGQLVTVLSGAGINIRSVMTSQTCINILVDRSALRRAHALLQGLALAGVDGVEARENLGLVALVGEGLDTAEAVLAKAMMALHDAGIHIDLTVSGASRVAAYLIVRGDRLDTAVRVVHQTLFRKV